MANYYDPLNQIAWNVPGLHGSYVAITPAKQIERTVAATRDEPTNLNLLASLLNFDLIDADQLKKAQRLSEKSKFVAEFSEFELPAFEPLSNNGIAVLEALTKYGEMLTLDKLPKAALPVTEAYVADLKLILVDGQAIDCNEGYEVRVSQNERERAERYAAQLGLAERINPTVARQMLTGDWLLRPSAESIKALDTEYHRLLEREFYVEASKLKQVHRVSRAVEHVAKATMNHSGTVKPAIFDEDFDDF